MSTGFGVIGTGLWGEFHAMVYAGHPGAELAPSAMWTASVPRKSLASTAPGAGTRTMLICCQTLRLTR